MVIASRLRKKLDSYSELADTIESVWSKGYTFHSKQELKNGS
jgi:DNA-binding response OmpR family regulator